jgi:hypothetical protein
LLQVFIHAFWRMHCTTRCSRVNTLGGVMTMRICDALDLLGFSLPNLARLSADWWTNPDPNTTLPRLADTWLLANRTAQPNLIALTVVFERAY